MYWRSRFPLLSLAWTLGVGLACAQSFRADVYPRTVVEGGSVNVAFEAEGGNLEAFEPPDFAGATVLAGPNQRSSIVMVDGRTETTESIAYELLPDAVGTLTIGSARARVGGVALETAPVEVSVTPPLAQKGATGIRAEDVAAARIVLSEDTVYVGEEFTVSLDLYNQGRIHTYSVRRAFELDGFREEAMRRYRASERRERLDGAEFSVRTIQRRVAYPSRAGTFAIGPAALQVNLVEPGGGGRRGFFFSPPTVPVPVVTNTATLTVLPLPAGAGDNFIGAVGEWRFEGQYGNLDSLSTADALTYRLFVQGRGDGGRLTPPELTWPAGWRAYPPDVILEQEVETDTGFVFTRAYEYTVAPQRGGAFTLEPAVSYFDPDRGEYVTWSPPPVDVDVRQVGPVSDPGSSAGSGQNAALALLREAPRPARESPTHRAWFWWVAGLGPLMILGARAVRRWRERSARRGGAREVGDPLAEGRRRLAAARAAIGEAPRFYPEVRTALERYAEDRLGLPASEQSDRELREAFAARFGAAEGMALAERFLEARALADRGLYGGGTDEAGRRAALEGLEGVLR